MFAEDVVSADLDGISDARLPELCECRVKGGLPDENGALSVDACKCSIPPSNGMAVKGARRFVDELAVEVHVEDGGFDRVEGVGFTAEHRGGEREACSPVRADAGALEHV